MSPRFLFIEEVRQALLSGADTIDVPEGGRITPAARDLIREKGLTIRYVALASKDADTATSSGGDSSAGGIQKAASGPERYTEQDQDYTDADIENIVTRVLDRFYAERSGEGHEPARANRPADDDDLIICRCEEITKGEIKDAIRNGLTTLNGIKRVTRAGMGLCQGQTCQRLVTRILAEELGVSPAEVEPVTARAPVRPIPLAVFATG